MTTNSDSPPTYYGNLATKMLPDAFEIFVRKKKPRPTKEDYKQLCIKLLANIIAQLDPKGRPGRPPISNASKIDLYTRIRSEMHNSAVGIDTACANVFYQFQHGCKNRDSLKAKFYRTRSYLLDRYTPSWQASTRDNVDESLELTLAIMIFTKRYPD